MVRAASKLGVARVLPLSAGHPDEPRAAGDIFERYSAYVAKIAHRILGRPSDVDDVVQDVFAVVVLKIDKVVGAPSVRLWLASATVKRARQVLRWRRVRAVWGADEDVDYSNIADPAARPDLHEVAATLYRALDRLPNEQRIAWTLRALAGEGLEDVARATGCSLATAKRRIAAAQSALREVIGE